MRTTKQCPKCESLTIGIFQKMHLSAGNTDGSVSLGGSFPMQAYSCADCGYFELYMQPLNTWKKPPDEYGLKFTWLRPPPPKTGPFR